MVNFRYWLAMKILGKLPLMCNMNVFQTICVDREDTNRFIKVRVDNSHTIDKCFEAGWKIDSYKQSIKDKND